ncbi:hypothetical protein [Aestuariibaculum sediminum]|uniref:DUF4369 domain-containing protein n=1 Tax=Aestuariibaculum sediminum TaxID=2770637 RepID=A0A8J6Q7G5_9FLAO|nr:hypothetical protein [Aestuariibaculum sediminum]MBD0832563.1 hypothetical protein [Aestuariibaculum sediminum]
MKNNLFYFIILLCTVYLVFGCQNKLCNSTVTNKNNFTVHAKLKNLKKGYVIIESKDESLPNTFNRDTVSVDNGGFTYTNCIDNYKIFSVYLPQLLNGKEYKNTKHSISCNTSKKIWFIGYPGARISIYGKVSNFVDGYPVDDKGVNNDLKSVFSQTIPIENIIENLISKSNEGELVQLSKKEINDSLSYYDNLVKNIKIEFIKSHPNSVAAAYLINSSYANQEFDNILTAKLIENMNHEKLREVSFYREVLQRLSANFKLNPRFYKH